MLRAPSLRGLTLLTWFACGACAGQARTGDPAAETDGNEQRPGRTDVESTGDGASNPVRNEPRGDSPASPRVEVPVASELCSFQAEEERLVFHRRYDERGVCVDFIMVRLGQGGIAPEGLSLPWDWGVGHASSYPCTPDGEIVGGESPTLLSQITGNIGMGGGLAGPAASLRLDISLSGPADAGSEPGERYSFSEGMNVSGTCDASAPWVNQPLNLQVERGPISVKGCTTIAAFNRIGLHQYEPVSATCTDFNLVADDELGTLPTDLSLPEGWRVEEMYSYSCLPDQSRMFLQATTYFTQATGSVSFDVDINGMPAEVWLDVSLSTPADNPDIPPELVIPTQRLSSADSIDVSSGCTGTW